MKVIRTLLIILFTLFSISSIADTITLRADEWCPYNCTPGSDKPGVLVEIAQYAFEGLGHTVEYETLNWSRSIEETRQGKYNGILGAYLEDADDFIFPENELLVASDCFYSLPGTDWQFNGADSLSNITVGVASGYSYGTEIDKHIKQYKNNSLGIVQAISGDDPLQTNLEKLYRDRIDAFIENSAVIANHLIASGKQSDYVKEVGCNGSQENVYIAFSPAHKDSIDYADILSKAVADLRASGQLQSILDKYGMLDWK